MATNLMQRRFTYKNNDLFSEDSSQSINDEKDMVQALVGIIQEIKFSRSKAIYRNGYRITRLNDRSLALTTNCISMNGISIQTYWVYLDTPESVVITNGSGQFLPLTDKLFKTIKYAII